MSNLIGRKIKAFSKSAALTTEVVCTDDNNVRLNIEVAPNNKHSGYNWRKKIIIQLNEIETPEFCALLMGYVSNASFKRKNKGVTFEIQDRKIFLTASQEEYGSYAMPITTGDVARLCTLVLSVYQKQTHSEAIINIHSLRMFAKS